MKKRTHSCGQLRLSHQNHEVCLAGWVNSYRDHGDLTFIDLRDRDGITQIVFRPDSTHAGTSGGEIHSLAKKLRSEDVIQVVGKCMPREKGMANAKMSTGEIEIAAHELTLLNKAQTPPFTPDTADQVSEELRLRYRYLDLRNPRMQSILRTRHRVTKIMRDYFDDHGFYEIETPFLCKSTPEGARDFLVPSRVQPGHFYALPQSPQLFKQILMVAGMEKYVQIVRCFRDEDPRADRQAEFTQLDMEMSFVDQDDVLPIVEGLVRRIWKEVLSVDVPPIPRMTWAEAMTRFGSDRPDLRFGLELKDISDLASTTEFGIFKSALTAGGVVKCLCLPGGGDMPRSATDALAEWSKGFGAKGLAVTKVTSGGKFDTGIAKFIQPIAPQLIERTAAKEGDLLCFAADKATIVHKVLGELRLKLAKERNLIPADQWKWLWVVDFPAFEYNEGEKRWDSLHHPFTSPRDQDMDKLDGPTADPGAIIAKAYDIVLNGSELGGGSIRIHNSQIQSKVFRLLGIDDESAKIKFGFLLDAFKFAHAPHGGIALGLDRIVMHLCNTTNIRDVMAFPKTQNAADLMTQAPSPVEEKQLRDLHLKLNLPQPTAPSPSGRGPG